jgi:hypothetical protein
MADKDEILAAIAALGTDLRTEMRNNHTDVMGKIDVIANGTGRIEAELAVVKADVRELRVDLAAHRMQTDARLTALEARP